MTASASSSGAIASRAGSPWPVTVGGVLDQVRLGGLKALLLAAARFVDRIQRLDRPVSDGTAAADRGRLGRGRGLLLGHELVARGRGVLDGRARRRCARLRSTSDSGWPGAVSDGPGRLDGGGSDRHAAGRRLASRQALAAEMARRGRDALGVAGRTALRSVSAAPASWPMPIAA